MTFARYLRQLLYRTPPRYFFCSTERYFFIKIIKSPLKKENKLETVGKKNSNTHRGKTKTVLTSGVHILLLIKNFLSRLFSASQDVIPAIVLGIYLL